LSVRTARFTIEIHAHYHVDDAARLSSSAKNDLPGREKEAKTELKVLGSEAGAKFDSAVRGHVGYTRDAM